MPPKITNETMTLQQFRYNFLKNEYFLSPHKNASFSAITVAFCIWLSYYLHLGIFAGALIIGAQSVTGINRQGPFRIRFGIAWKTALVLSFAALLGAIAGSGYFFLSLLVSVVLAFCFGWCRQLFPLNWPDIIIPSGVLFFLNYSHPMVFYTLSGAVIGFCCELLLGIFIYLKRYRAGRMIFAPSAEFLPPPPDNPDKKILGLKQYLFVYSIELSIMLIFGFFVMHYTDYPHVYWMPLTAIIVLKVGRRVTIKRVVERTLGTLAGCLLGSVILYFHFNPLFESGVMVCCIYLWVCYFRRNYALGTVFITTFVLLLLNENVSDAYTIVFERMIFTVLGGVLAIVVSLAFLKKERL